MEAKAREKQKTEAVLIKQAQAGDALAFEQLVSAYSTMIFNVGLKMLSNREDAADMTQETLVKAYCNLSRFRGASSFSTWLYRIGVNTCLDMLRLSYRNKERVFSDFADDDGISMVEATVIDPAALPEERYTDAETAAYLNALIAALTPKYRIVFSLREISGISYQEIADICNLSLGTVKSRLNRARQALREQILKDAEQCEDLLRLINRGRIME